MMTPVHDGHSRPLSEILSEKEIVTANLKKASAWCIGGLIITILSLIVLSHTGFSIITLGAIGWGGWNVYKCLKKLDELKKEEELLHKSKKKSSLRSKTFK